MQCNAADLTCINPSFSDFIQDQLNFMVEMENGSILLALQMRHILASLDSVASAADRIQKKT